MKRFRFALQPLMKVKQTLEKQLKGELLQINMRLRILQEEKTAEEDRLAKAAADHQARLRRGAAMAEVSGYPGYCAFQCEVIDGLSRRIEATLQERAACQEKLIAIMKDLKMLENLRERKYAEYLQENEREAQKEMDDFVSYGLSAGASAGAASPAPAQR